MPGMLLALQKLAVWSPALGPLQQLSGLIHIFLHTHRHQCVVELCEASTPSQLTCYFPGATPLHLNQNATAAYRPAASCTRTRTSS